MGYHINVFEHSTPGMRNNSHVPEEFTFGIGS